MTINLKENERIDDLQRNDLKIIQNSGKFCFGMDAVLLTGFACDYIRNGSSVIDLGTGTGIIPILLSAKCRAKKFVGLEIQEESADMARRSVALNNLQDKIDIVTGDIKEAGNIFTPASFQVVTCNPPYMIDNHGLKNVDAPMTIARHEVLCSLEDVVSSASKLLVSGGHFYMVHRPFRLAEIFVLMNKYHMEPKRMQMIHPYIDKEPNMVLIDATKGGKPRLTVEKPLVIYKEPGIYHEDVYDIYGY